MKISQEVRALAGDDRAVAEGLAERAAAFRAAGGDVYLAPDEAAKLAASAGRSG